MFSRDYCRDIGDSARIADDEQGHKLFAGEGFHRPSMFLFCNSNVVKFAQLGEARHGRYRPCRSYCAAHRSLAGWGEGFPRVQAPRLFILKSEPY
jgi:hypothetical protein